MAYLKVGNVLKHRDGSLYLIIKDNTDMIKWLVLNDVTTDVDALSVCSGPLTELSTREFYTLVTNILEK